MNIRYPHLADIRHLPRLQRLIHPNARKHTRALVLSTGVMVFGSSIAVYHWIPIPHLLADTLAYGLHGIGLIPIAKHLEPLWLLIME